MEVVGYLEMYTSCFSKSTFLRFLKKNSTNNSVIDSVENEWWKLALPTNMGADRGSGKKNKKKQGDIDLPPSHKRYFLLGGRLILLIVFHGCWVYWRARKQNSTVGTTRYCM